MMNTQASNDSGHTESPSLDIVREVISYWKRHARLPAHERSFFMDFQISEQEVINKLDAMETAAALEWELKNASMQDFCNLKKALQLLVSIFNLACQLKEQFDKDHIIGQGVLATEEYQAIITFLRPLAQAGLWNTSKALAPEKKTLKRSIENDKDGTHKTKRSKLKEKSPIPLVEGIKAEVKRALSETTIDKNPGETAANLPKKPRTTVANKEMKLKLSDNQKHYAPEHKRRKGAQDTDTGDQAQKEPVSLDKSNDVK